MALHWYQRAAELGNEDAKKAIENWDYAQEAEKKEDDEITSTAIGLTIFIGPAIYLFSSNDFIDSMLSGFGLSVVLAFIFSKLKKDE